MAVLAPSDWQHTMDVPSGNKQRSSPAGEHTPTHSGSAHGAPNVGFQQPQQAPQPYPYPVNQQQAQGAWTPSLAAQPFYPTFYQNHPPQQQPYPAHMAQGGPYFDPANAQLAQWAYHQMMMNAQQFPHMAPPQRNASAPSTSSDYFSQNQIPNVFNPFPSGTPPPPHRGQQQPGPAQDSQQYPGFHPYRRPQRQGSQASEPPQPPANEWRSGGAPHPAYARPDASGSTSSVNSSHSSRQRTNSNQSGQSGHNVPPPNGSVRSRTGSPGTPPSAASSARSSQSSLSPAPSSTSRVPHSRSLSSSSSGSTATSNRPAPSTSSPVSSQSSVSTTNPRPARPSPLSQGTFTASEKRMSRDDSDLAAMLDTPSAGMMRSGGLKGRLRRALSLNAAQTLKEEEDAEDDDESIKASAASKKPKVPLNIQSALRKPGGGIPTPDSGADDASTRAPSTVQTKKKGRAASLFSSRLNASTDNISLSSTVSSASVMIRKLGSMGKLARRNSLAGITSLFKDKDKDKDKDDKKDKKKDKKGTAKGSASEASVSHVTAELDRSTSGSDWSVGNEMNGLSPAAKLARQHTLKSNAEAAALAKAQREAEAAATVNAKAAKVNGNSGVGAWDKNTTSRHGTASPVKAAAGMRVNEDGTRVLVEEDDDDSDDGHYGRQAGPNDHADGWDDDEEWDEGEEDVTIRQELERVSLEDDYEEHDVWAQDIRRSAERSRAPAKGILKHAGSYDQKSYLAEPPSSTLGHRLRSNSYNSHSQSELGPLARIPSPDPDHIDGLVRHPSHSSAHAPSLPPLSFDLPSSLDATTDSPTSVHAPIPEKASAIFNHPNLNSSAPALSTMMSSAPTLTHRSATAPTSKRLAFASNLSVYDTFSANVYDRRSEPATWSRLTPQLAQRIKEELNSYKMEEMEVHAASRIHTQFFV